MKTIFIVLSINKKCVSVLSTLETESSAVHIAHRGKKLYFSYFFFETWFHSGSVGKTTWLGTRRRRTPTSTTPQRGWRGPGWSRHPFQVSPFCSHSVSFVLSCSHSLSFVLILSHDQTLQEKRRRNLLLELRHLEKRGGYWTVCMKNVIVKWVGKPKENVNLSLS